MTIYDILSRHADLEAVVLDVGANLGIHGLYAAKLGYRVWAIEPQERNLIKVTFIIRFMFIIAFINDKKVSYSIFSIFNIFIKIYRSASKSGLLDRLTFVQNGIDGERRAAVMGIHGKNNGRSYVKFEGNEEKIKYERTNYSLSLNSD